MQLEMIMCCLSLLKSTSQPYLRLQWELVARISVGEITQQLNSSVDPCYSLFTSQWDLSRLIMVRAQWHIASHAK